MKIGNYEVKIFYSAEDVGYIAIIPDLPGCSAWGATKEEVLQEINIVASLHLNIKGENNANN